MEGESKDPELADVIFEMTTLEAEAPDLFARLARVQVGAIRIDLYPPPPKASDFGEVQVARSYSSEEEYPPDPLDDPATFGRSDGVPRFRRDDDEERDQ